MISKPVLDKETMAALRRRLYEEFWRELEEKNIDAGGIKRLAAGYAVDSAMREVLEGLPAKISKLDIIGLVNPLLTLARREDRVGAGARR